MNENTISIASEIVKAKSEPPASTSIASQILAEQKRRREIEGKLAEDQNKRISPELQAEAIPIAKATSLPIDVARRNLDVLKAEQPTPDLDKAKADAPSYAKMLQDNAHGPIAQSAVSEMPYFERVFRSYGQAFSGGFEDLETSDIGYRRMQGTATPQDLERLNQLKEERKKRTDFRIGGVAEFFQYPVQSAPAMGATVARTWDEVLIGGATGLAAGAFTGPGAVAGGVTGAGIGARVGFVKESYEQLAGDAYNEALEALDENGNPLDEDSAYTIATFAGGIGAAAELLPFEKALDTMPFLKGVVGKEGARRLAGLATQNPAVRASLARMGRILKVGGAEAFTEVVQEALLLEGIIAAGGVTDEQGNVLADQRAERYGEAALGGFAGGTTLGAAGEAVTATVDKVASVRAKRAEAKQQALVELGEKIRSSRVNGMSPETVVAHAKQMDADGAAPQMSAPAEALVKLFQSEGLTAEQVQEQFPTLSQALDEAAQTGAEVTLNAETVVKLARLEKFADITGDIRTSPGELTANEAKQADVEFNQMLESMSEEDIAKAVNASVHKDVMNQLVAAGTDPKVAETQAKLFTSVISNLAERTGMQPDQLLKRYGLTITGDESVDTAAADPNATMMQDTPEFQNWFGDSQVRDAGGKPLVVYKGMPLVNWRDGKPIETIDSPNGPWAGFFSSSPETASRFADAFGFTGSSGVVPAFVSIKRPLEIDAKGAPAREFQFDNVNPKNRNQEILTAIASGEYDGVVIRNTADEGDIYVPLDPTQVKSVNNRGTFDPQDPRILYQSEAPTVDGQSQQPGNKHGFMPHLRVETGAEIPAKKKPLFAQVTMNSTAPRQIAAIDEVLGRHPNATASVENWNAMMSDALASNDVPLPPYNFIKNLNGDGSQKLLAKLSAGQIADADHGFANAAAFRQSYINGRISIESTGKLFLWSFLSRGVSPYTQESLFIDSFDGIGQWIKAAADGTLKDRLPEYEAWAKSAAPQGSGQPGAGATHNLNAFGKLFLLKMSEDAGDGTGRSRLQVLHDMMSDPNSTGKQIRRKFLEMGEGVGIDNKVVSFTLLVAGFDDLMVLDRVQIRELWNDGRFDGINLYDGYKADGKPVAGSALSNLTYGARGLLIYEAIEQGLTAKIKDLYAALGRPDAASVGRYHWETWVASSNQEASHATIDAILAGAKGVPRPLAGVTAKEGEYGAYAYGARYGRDGLGHPYFLYSVPGSGDFRFSVEKFREFLSEIQVRANGVIPSKFKVTESGNGPWFNRKEVSLDKLAQLAERIGERYTAGRLSDVDEANGIDPPVPDRSPAGEPGTAQEEVDGGPQAGPSSSGETTLFQKAQSTTTFARGSITFTPARDKFKITLTGKADLSTFMHESAHYFLEVLQDLVEKGDAPQQIMEDLGVIRRWAGVPMGGKIERVHHEKFARGFEAYLMEGRAPSTDLQSVFNRFRAWLVFIYKKLTALNVELTDDVRGVMDRLVASDREIAEARTNVGWSKPLPKEALYLSDDEYDRYVEAWNKANEAQQREVDAALMLEAAREAQEAWKAERKKVFDEEKAKLAQTRGYRAWKLLSEGEGLQDVRPGWSNIKIDPATVPSEWRRDAAGMTAPATEGGLPLEAVAEILGFKSGEEMLSTIAGAKFANRELPRQVQKIMDERHGALDMTALADLAMQAVHSDKTQEVLLTEFRAMASRARIGAAPVGMTKWMAAQAEQRLLGLTRRQLDPTRWRRGELKAATDSAKAAAKGDVTKAAVHKRQQMMAAAMYRATVDAQKRIETIRKKLLPFTKNDRRAQLGKAGDLYLDGIDEILEGIQFKQMTAKSVMKLDRLAKLVEEADKNGEPLVLPDKLRAMLGKKNFADMTLEELEGVHDSVMNIWHLAKTKNELKARKEKRELEEALTEMEANAQAALGDPKVTVLFTKGWTDRAASTMRSFRAGLTKMEFLFGWLDGKPDGGLMHRLIYQPIADANKAKFDILKRFHETIIERMRSMPNEQKARWESKRTFMGNPTANGATIIAAALNLGNEGNKQKLLEGYGWNEQRLMAEINGFMTKADWDFVQHVWDEIDTLWPKIEATTKAATGLAPEKVVPSPIVTPFGTYAGGYYPVVYDPEQTEQQFKNQQETAGLFTNNYARPTLGDGFTKARVQYSAPILLQLSVISQHLAEVVHYVTHYEAVTQADKIMRHPRFQAVVKGHMGNEFYRTLRPWLQDVARDQDTPAITRQEPFAKAMRHLRGGVSIAAMGYNIFTGLKQLIGIVQSLDAVGPKYWLSGLSKAWLSPNAIKNWKFAFQNSQELEPLVTQLDRDIKMINDAYAKEGTLSIPAKVASWAFKHIGWLQAAVNVATWHGAYEQDMARNGGDHDKAVMHADAVVRQTQSAGAVKDLSPIQRGSEINRAVSMFYSWFNVLYNRFESIARETRSIRDVPKAAARVAILVMMSSMIEEAARRAYEAVVDNYEDDEEEPGFILSVLLKSADTAIGAIPLGRAFFSAQAATGGMTPDLVPVAGVVDDYWRTLRAAYDIVAEGEAPSRSEVKTAVRTVSIIGGVPLSGPYNFLDEIFGEAVFGEGKKTKP